MVVVVVVMLLLQLLLWLKQQQQTGKAVSENISCWAPPGAPKLRLLAGALGAPEGAPKIHGARPALVFVDDLTKEDSLALSSAARTIWTERAKLHCPPLTELFFTVAYATYKCNV